jgi:hypothetical protein
MGTDETRQERPDDAETKWLEDLKKATKDMVASGDNQPNKAEDANGGKG